MPDVVVFVRPVFLFVLCNPHENQHLAPLRSELRGLLIKHYRILSTTVDSVLEWTKINSSSAFMEYLQFLLDVFEIREKSLAKNSEAKKATVIVRRAQELPFLSSLCYQAIVLGLNVDQLVNEIKSRIISIVAFANEQSCDKEDACGAIYSLSESANITIM